MDSEHVDRSQLHESDADCQVLFIYICAFAMESSESAGAFAAANRWSIFLQISTNESVRLDIFPGRNNHGLTGTLTLVSVDEVYPDDVLRVMLFRTLGQPTVKLLVETLVGKGREKYQFTQDERGGRYWVHTVVSDWEEAEFLPVGSAEIAKADLTLRWHAGGSFSIEIVPGVFY